MVNTQVSGTTRFSDLTVIAIAAGMVVVLLPLVLLTVAHVWTAFIVAGILLGFAAAVRPEGNAAPLRWFPLAFGVFSLLGAMVGLFI